MTKKQLKKYAAQIRELYKSSPNVRKIILQNSQGPLVKLLSECAYNILRGNVALTQTQKRNLKKHKDCLRAVASKKTRNNTKTALFMRGGFLSALIAPIVGLLSKLW